MKDDVVHGVGLSLIACITGVLENCECCCGILPGSQQQVVHMSLSRLQPHHTAPSHRM